MSDSKKSEAEKREVETLKCLNDIKKLLTLLLLKTEVKAGRTLDLKKEVEWIVSAKDGLDDLFEIAEVQDELRKLEPAMIEASRSPLEVLAEGYAKTFWANDPDRMERFNADKMTFKDLSEGLGRATGNKNPTRLMKQRIDVPIRNAVGDAAIEDVLKRAIKTDKELLGSYLGRVKGSSLSKFPLPRTLFSDICVILELKRGMDPMLYFRHFL